MKRAKNIRLRRTLYVCPSVAFKKNVLLFERGIQIYCSSVLKFMLKQIVAFL